MRSQRLYIWVMRAIALLCGFVFLFSSFMTGTYAWKSEQKALNNTYGSRDAMIPVELIKLEKTADGVITERPIADTVFYLFRESGVQIGGRYITDENGRISVMLNAGSYYFEEISPGIGYTYDTAPDGSPVTKYFFTVSEELERVTVQAYNVRLDGDLMIRKTVENTDGSPLTEEQRNTAFVFTVEFSDGGTYAYRVDNGEEQMLTDGGALELRSGQTALFKELPVGVLYNVTETPVEGYAVSATGHRGNITETQSVADFVNRYGQSVLGGLTVTKEVIGENADPDKEFMFTAVLGDVTENFTLKDGETKEFVGLTIGTEYTVTETDHSAEGYTSQADTYTGRIISSDVLVLPFVNIYSEEPPVDKYGSICISKKVLGVNADPDKVFTFEVSFTGEGAHEDCSFTLKADEEYLIEGIPHGTGYTVTETDTAGYGGAVISVNGTVFGEHTAKIAFVNIAPEEQDKTVKLTVKKILDGELIVSDRELQFNMTLTVDGETFEFTLKGDESRDFDVPIDAVYEVSESDYFRDGFSQYVENGTGTVTESPIEVTVTNTYVGETRIEITGQKKWELNGNDGVTLPDSITLQLKNGDVLVEEKTVFPGDDEEWKYSFTVPKYNADGSEALYTLTELPIEGFSAVYDGYNITNIYMKPIDVELPVIRKIVEGEDAPKSAFEFIFTGQHGTPMPEDSVSYRKILTLNGAGELEIGTVRYDRAGTYVYTVHERNLGAEYWSYDTALYTVTVVITEEEHILTAEVAYEKSGASVEEIVFVNTFETADDETVVISGVKTWRHGDNPKEQHPTQIIVEVYGDGVLVQQKAVGEDDNWRYSFELPRYDHNGREIIYTVDEADVENYEKQIDGYDIINKYVGTSDEPDNPDPVPGTDPVPDTDPTDDPYIPDSPQTGDGPRLRMWFTVMIVSLIGFIATVIFDRIQRHAYVGKHRK